MSKITYECTGDELDKLITQAHLDTAEAAAAVSYMTRVYISNSQTLAALEQEKAHREQDAKAATARREKRKRKLPKSR